MVAEAAAARRPEEAAGRLTYFIRTQRGERVAQASGAFLPADEGGNVAWWLGFPVSWLERVARSLGSHAALQASNMCNMRTHGKLASSNDFVVSQRPTPGPSHRSDPCGLNE